MLRREENSSEDDFVTKSFPLFTKKKIEHSFEVSLFICVFSGVFFILNCETLFLSQNRGMVRFTDGVTSLAPCFILFYKISKIVRAF